MQYTILLFYSYIPLSSPETTRDTQEALARVLDMKGRIIIAKEGINGTIEGTHDACVAYMKAMRDDPDFASIEFKESGGNGDSFPRLSVKTRRELCSAHLDEDDVSPWEDTSTHLPPNTLHEWIKRGEKFEIIDMRNDYEYEVGHFRNSRPSGMKHFRDLRKIARDLTPLKEKKILTVCTGGIRCEKASAYLKKQGFKKVYQLRGGIISYMKQYPGENFLGSLYVFDGRRTMTFAPYQPISACLLCNQLSDRYVNCIYPECDKHFICCTTCAPMLLNNRTPCDTCRGKSLVS